MESHVVKEIIEVEEKLKTSMLNSDTIALQDLLSDDLVFVNHLGHRTSKQDDIALHSSGLLVIKSIQFHDLHVVPQKDVVLVYVNAEIKGSYNGAVANGEFAFSRVWTKQKGNWQVISAHSTVIA
ncbi:TPA: nuclear transport factor 2 family protein [Vibrio diabolicus]|uniref:nuclear transport factor 2 family protein n=1 Tax=Vibrio antiquarius (strain Ex25) TaxID=150340 RepID=UPI002657DE11|nr:nuclear transport factor 2 family protein [Vibrio antiquarius]MCR9632217.1 nuclear transport factor 2 family protein [Vibrio antiquarius]